VNRTLNTLQKAFLLRSCSDSVYESRTRPCMLHQIKRCAAPESGAAMASDMPADIGGIAAAREAAERRNLTTLAHRGFPLSRHSGRKAGGSHGPCAGPTNDAR
jgi:excinuclease ABC subunit C